jgi:hypothetical protein
MSKITPDLLINSGYRQHKPGLGHEHAEALYQKAFSDDLGIKYYRTYAENLRLLAGG